MSSVSEVPDKNLVEELKSCPFCGAKAEIGTASVFCTNDNCGAQIWASQPHTNMQFAITAWNRRLIDQLPY